VTAQAEAARSLINARRYEDAVRVALEGLSTSPDDYELHCLVAQACLGMRQPKNALAAADRAVGLAPDNEWPHRLRSIALRTMERAAEACDSAREAVRLAPTAAAPRRNLCDAYLASNQVDRAFAEAIEAVRLEPESARSHEAMGRCLLGRMQFKDAEASFRRALEIESTLAQAHHNLGRALQSQGLAIEGLHAFDAAARIDPGWESPRRNLYWGTRIFFTCGTMALVALFVLVGLALVFINLIVSPPASIFLSALAVLAYGWSAYRYLSVGDRRFPRTAIAYYTAEKRRRRRLGLRR
jgi:tetratricopeptide (TPR) repeat protein